MTFRLVVLASGNGSNLQAIIDACENGSLKATVVGVISDNPHAFALQRATQHDIATATITPEGLTKSVYNASLAQAALAFQPHMVVLAGFMRLLANEFISHFPSAIINLHPALPGELPGVNAIERAFKEFVSGTRASTGVMVHRVTDEDVDNGAVIASQTVPMHSTDSLYDLENRVHETEHQLLITALSQLAKEHIT